MQSNRRKPARDRQISEQIINNKEATSNFESVGVYELNGSENESSFTIICS